MSRQIHSKHVLAVLAVLGLGLSAAISMAAESESWDVVDQSMTEYSGKVDGWKGKLSELREEKARLFNETYAISNEDRAVAREPKTANHAQEAQLQDLNTEIRSTEAKIDRSLKKKEYLQTVKTKIHDEDSLEATLTEVDHTVSSLEGNLKPIRSRMQELTQSCKECKVVLNSLDREPSSESAQLREFRSLMRKRNEIEGSLDSYGLQVEALRDVKAYHNGQETIANPQRYTGPRSIDSVR